MEQEQAACQGRVSIDTAGVRHAIFNLLTPLPASTFSSPWDVQRIRYGNTFCSRADPPESLPLLATAKLCRPLEPDVRSKALEDENVSVDEIKGFLLLGPHSPPLCRSVSVAKPLWWCRLYAEPPGLLLPYPPGQTSRFTGW